MNTPKTTKQYQQGDVILVKLDKLPIGKRITIAKGRIVLAHGENGHSHVIEDDEAELIQIGERMILSLSKTATLRHDEHHPQAYEPGLWEVGQVREFDWFQQMERKVID